MTDVPVTQEAGKTYPRLTWAASHKHTCNLCHMDKNPADGCNCGAELIDLIRSEMMSDEHPISEWEVRFAEKIKALPMFARHRQQAERDVIARMEVVGWMYVRKANEIESAATLIHRRRWSPEQAKGWTETPLYALPTPPEAA